MIRQAFERLGNIFGSEQKILLSLKLSAMLVNWLVCFLDWVWGFFRTSMCS